MHRSAFPGLLGTAGLRSCFKQRIYKLPPQAFVEHYGVAPEVTMSGDTSLTIPYIPAHLDYML